ncbi:MAG: rhodanese-like domain-containing protein [Acidimicrobiia bacterium]|nr:rhodanese-like domain-containing protein [Acidimicrobiia bacterium]
MDMLRRNTLIALLLAFAMVFAACGDDASTDTTDAPLADDSPLATTEAPPATTEAPPETTAAPETTEAPAAFDVNAAVVSYVKNIPEGWMAVGDTIAFIDQVEASDAYIIDVRTEGEYADGHIMDAVNIPLRTLAQNLDQIPADRQVFIYCKSGWRAGLATSSLRMIGYDNILAYPPGWNGWTAAEEPVTADPDLPETFGDPGFEPAMVEAVDGFLSTIPEGFLTAGDANAVNEALTAGAVALDVRTDGEVADGRIPNALHAPVRTIGETDVDIPTDTTVIVYCKSGWRASLTVPVLHLLGYDNVKGFTGSWLAWQAAELPIEA